MLNTSSNRTIFPTKTRIRSQWRDTIGSITPGWLKFPYYFAWRLGGLVGVNLLWMVLVQIIFAGLLYLCWRSSGNFKSSVIAASWPPRHKAPLCDVATVRKTCKWPPDTCGMAFEKLILCLPSQREQPE